MITLHQIKEFAIKHNACSAQLNNFIQFIELNDELSAWQTVLGNISWLEENGLTIDINYIESKANHIAKQWNSNGQLEVQCTYKNGKIDGLYRWWYDNGQLRVEYTYKNGKIDGLYRSWYENGQLYREFTYKNGERIS